MTIRTGNINMFPVESESCFVMIEPGSLPGFSIMAVVTVGDTILLKLSVMVINMATGTGNR